MDESVIFVLSAVVFLSSLSSAFTGVSWSKCDQECPHHLEGHDKWLDLCNQKLSGGRSVGGSFRPEVQRDGLVDQVLDDHGSQQQQLARCEWQCAKYDVCVGQCLESCYMLFSSGGSTGAFLGPYGPPDTSESGAAASLIRDM